jgi:chromosome segregation ATPase
MENSFLNKDVRGYQAAFADDPNAIIAGLRDAQEELEGETLQEVGSFPPSSAPNNNSIESQIESYSEKIQLEKSKLEELKVYIEERNNKVDKRLERISELEQAMKTVKENMRIISTELSLGEEKGEEIMKQFKQKFESNEQRKQHS